MYRKNTASQFVCFQGVDATTGGIKSGVTWTMRRCLDGTFAAGGATITEDGTAGWYKAALTQADTNGNDCSYNFTGTGAVPQTVNIVTTACDPTVATNFGITSLPATAVTTNASLLTSGTGTDQLSVTSGRIDIGKALGNAITTTANGIPDVNAKNINNVSASSVTTINANLGLTQAATFNANNFLKVSLNDILATTLTETSGQLAGGFKQWFNVAAPVGTVNSIPNATAGASGGLFIAGTNAATTITTSFTTTFTGNLTGSVASVSGAVGSVTGLTASNLDTTVSSRMATYTQPTGFLAATFPATVSSFAGGAVASVTGTVGGIAGTTQTLDALQTALSATHGSGEWSTATGFAVPGDAMTLTAPYEFAKGTVALTESYRANGTAPTPAQAFFEVLAHLGEMSITGTTKTINKIDHTTVAETYTLNSATAPTAITRAT